MLHFQHYTEIKWLMIAENNIYLLIPGQYLFISPSTQEIHETALLISEPIQTSGNIWKCLKFWYFMNGENVGSLHVRFEVIGQSNSTIWQLYGNQSANYWNPASVPFYGKGLEGRVIYIYI